MAFQQKKPAHAASYANTRVAALRSPGRSAWLSPRCAKSTVVMHIRAANHDAVIMHRGHGRRRRGRGDAAERRSGQGQGEEGGKDCSPDVHDSSRAFPGPTAVL